jgi:cell division protein ZapC
MLQPTNQWKWQFCQQKEQLSLDIDPTMAFTTAYQGKQLTNEVHDDTAFSIDDAYYYQYITAQLQSLSCWSEPQMVQMALNATAVFRFHKPMMPKSWFFKSNEVAVHNAQQATQQTTRVLYTQFGSAEFLVVEQNESVALCMLLDESLQLNESKSMAQFDVIKVMNDRLFNVEEAKQLRYG